MDLSPTQAAGCAALADFNASAGRAYAEMRNFDHGPERRENISMLSRYLRYRLITEEEVIAAVHARHTREAAGKFVQEVLWRTYWKGWLELRPAVWEDYVADVMRLEAQSGGARRDYERALAGSTGIDCFDAWVGELVEHGYLHNHARMWFASIWIFTLQLPWQLGAALFWRHLYDGDPASNTLSWRWVAGLQTPGKTYLARPDNIARYTGGRFTPSGLATSAAPVAGPPLPKPRQLPAAAPAPAGRIGLLIAEDDLEPETLPLGAAQVVAVASLGAQHDRDANVERFIDGALSDARARTATAFGIKATPLPDPTAAAVRDWAQAHQLDTLAVGYAPVGPGATVLDAISRELAAGGITLHRIRRDWDSKTWPHAQRGFFAFHERVAPLL